MKTNRQENTRNESLESSARRNEGFAAPSRGVSKDAGASGRDRNGHENNNDAYIEEEKHFNPVRDVPRKTELLGWDVWPANHKRRKIPVEPDEETDNPEEK